MKALAILLLLCLVSPARAATFDEFLNLGGSEFDGVSGSSFLEGVLWEDDTQRAYYQCTDRLGKVALELWQGEGAWVRPRGEPVAPLVFGRHGSVRVFSLFSEDKEPSVAAYFMLPSGETHLFRVRQQEVILSSIQWQCTPVDWQPPGEQH